MTRSRAFYRIRQLWQTLFAKPSPELLQQTQRLLPPALFELFCAMPLSEQAHALEVYQRLCRNGSTDKELLTAALLHDVGKKRHPLRIWERVLVVLVQHFAPDTAKSWGAGEMYGLKRSLVVAAKHPAWGADMAAEYGASARVAELIRRHHEEIHQVEKSATEQLLALLQAADDHN